MNCFRCVFGVVCVLAVGIGFAVGRADPTDYVSKLETEPLRYEVKFVPSRTLAPGRSVKVQDGVDGVIKRMVQYTLVDGKVIDKKVLWETRVEPRPAIIRYGSPNTEITRGYTRADVIPMDASGYCPCSLCGSGTGRTAMGIPARKGVVAVDPSVIPLNSIVFVEGYGLAIAADKGSSVKGNRIDLCFNTHAEALKFGRRKVKVHILR